MKRSKVLVAFQPRVDPEEKPLPPDRKKNSGTQEEKRQSDTGFDLRTEAYKLFGVDVTQIPGLMVMVVPLFSEVGRDMSRGRRRGTSCPGWHCARTTTSAEGGWCGGECEKCTTAPGSSFAWRPILHHDRSPLGDYLRRMKSKMGPAGATTATAHKIAIIFYTMVKKQVEYDETSGPTRRRT